MSCLSRVHHFRSVALDRVRVALAPCLNHWPSVLMLPNNDAVVTAVHVLPGVAACIRCVDWFLLWCAHPAEPHWYK